MTLADDALAAALPVIAAEITSVLQGLPPETFDALCAALGEREGRLFFSGQGRSGLVAQMAAMRFMHLGHAAHAVGEVSAPSIRAGDRLVLLSGSGTTPVSLSFARIAKAEGAAVIVISRNAASPLAALADHLCLLPGPESRQFGGSLFEQSCLLVLDAVALQQSGGTARRHAEMTHRHTNLQ